MLNLVARDAAPALAKAFAEVAVNAIKENPLKSLATAAVFLLGYEKGRADTYSELTNAKRI